MAFNRDAIRLLDSRILSCYREICALAAGHVCAPRTACIYPTYACNHKCIGCDYGEANNADVPAQMTGDQLTSCLAQFARMGAQSWEACGGGEPTIHPDLPDAIRFGARLGLRFGLLTNGTLLHRPGLQGALLAHGSYCRVSLESATAETFNRYKRPRSEAAGFDRVCANIQELIAARDAAGSALLVSMKFSIDRNNAGDVLSAFRLAEALRVDSLQFKAIRNVPSALDDAAAHQCQEQIDAGRNGHPGLTVTGSLAKTRINCRCWLSPLMPTVDPSGRVFLCCYYRHRAERHGIGNMFESPLSEIWGRREHIEKISAIEPAECNAYDCRAHGYHETVGDLSALQLEFI